MALQQAGGGGMQLHISRQLQGVTDPCPTMDIITLQQARAGGGMQLHISRQLQGVTDPCPTMDIIALRISQAAAASDGWGYCSDTDTLSVSCTTKTITHYPL